MDKIKVLIVEDETIVAFDIESALENLGFEVCDCALNYDEAVACVKEYSPDIILMDINLKDSKKDGIDTVKDIKKIKDIPIIYLTAFSDDETINRAIETDPIGYLIKPFKREELKSTIKLGFHKLKHEKKDVEINSDYINLDENYYFDMKNQILFYLDIPIKLSKNERVFLSILISAKGNVVSFSDIEREVWPDKVVANSTFRSLVHRFRGKIDYKFIHTLPGIGCKLYLN